jgi:glycosyltransferase involved in cell wall biosynthesis
MRIVIDLQGAQTESRFRGIGRYSLSMAKAIVRNRGEHEVIIVLSGFFHDTIEPIRAQFDDLLPQDNIRVWYAPGPVTDSELGNTWRREAAELIREAFIASLQPDIVHITSLFEGYEDDGVTSVVKFDQATPVSVSLYDLIPLLNPEHYLNPNPAYEQYYLRKIANLKDVSLLLSISEFSREEALEHLNIDSAAIVNISTAVDECFHSVAPSKIQADLLLSKFGVTRSILLYSGGGDDRKNLPRLILAYSQLSAELRDTHQLVFAGRIPNTPQLQNEAKASGLRLDELIFTGYITDDELVKLYSLCRLYIFPSWHEGFGLPALEAMSCGAAVIGANTSSLPEVIGNEEALFDPYSVKSISSKITQALTDDVFRQGLIIHGLEQAKLFSWDKTAIKAIASFEDVISPKLPTQYEDLSGIESKLIESISGLADKLIASTESDLLWAAQSISVSLGETRQPKLFIDVSQLVITDHKTGIQRVVRAIASEWLSTPPEGWEIEPVYLTNEQGKCQYHYADDYKKNHSNDGLTSTGVVVPQYGDVFLGLDLFSSVRDPNCEVMFVQWKARGVKVHFVVYDVLPIFNPQWWPPGGGEVHTDWLNAISKIADSLISISRAVSDNVQVYLHERPVERIRPLKFSWFHLGADVDNSMPSTGLPNDATMVLRELGHRSTFLIVGTIEPRKGQLQALDAFENLWANDIDINLVIVGKEGWMVEGVIEKIKCHPELGKRLFWLDGISDEYLEKVYIASTCLIAASEGEGFGLPLIEAAQKSLPIIARDIPVFREVAGEYAFYFSGLDASVLSTAIQNWIVLYKEHNHPQSSSMPWLTWNESAEMLIECIGIKK